MSRQLWSRKALNPYTRPFVGPGTGSTLVPSDYNSPNLLWKWNERDVTQFGSDVCRTSYDPVAPAGTGYNTTNGGTFNASASYIASGTNSSVGPRVRFTGIGQNGTLPSPTNNQGGCLFIPIRDCPLLPRRFIVNYRLVAIGAANVGGWGFGIRNAAGTLIYGYTHNGSTASVVINNYDVVTPNAAGTYWPWISAANTRNLANVTTLTSSTNLTGAIYLVEWNHYYDETGANPPRGYCAPSCTSNVAALNTANSLIQTAGATASFLGTTPNSGFNGFVGTQLGLICRFPNPGNITQTADFAEIYVTKHPMDQL